MEPGDFTRIRTNVQATQLLTTLRQVNTHLATHQLRLATGARINSAADDPAGLTMATKLNAQYRVYSTLADNAGQAKNLLAVAEGALLEINEMLTTMSEEITSAASDTLGDEERAAVTQTLIDTLAEIDETVAEVTFNGTELLGGVETFTFQVGTRSQLSWTTSSFDASSLGLTETAALAEDDRIDSSNYETYGAEVEAARSVVSSGLNEIGSLINRLTVKENVLSVMQTNTEAAYNRIYSADSAEELIEVTKYQILQESVLSVLSQAVYNTQAVLSLFD